MLCILTKIQRVILNHRHIRKLSNASIDVSQEIKSALKENKPIVALESTIITHGMPYPTNLETCVACQELIRNEGCIPAVVSILKGCIKVGMSEEELKYLAENSEKTIKTSRRDFPYVLANKLSGGTTVSGTIIVANTVGIKVFATGGIGGVHRRGETTMDISADLLELGRNPIMVVSSGVKSILDIGKTLEYLETNGVLVTVYSDSRTMPAFFSRDSAFKAPYNVTTPEHASSLIHSLDDLGLKSGILLAVPIPKEYSIDYELMESHIESAIKEADSKNIKGKEITPYLLDKVNILTKGKSLESNVALTKRNSTIAAKIAFCHSESKKRRIKDSKLYHLKEEFTRKKKPVVIGGCVLDSTVRLRSDCQFDGRTVPADTYMTCGGVGRNVADALGKLDLSSTFISAVGDDQNGQTVLDSLLHIDSRGVEILQGQTTANYTVLLGNTGECLLCAGNSDIHSKTNVDQITRYLNEIKNSDIIVVDCNISQEIIDYIIELSYKFKKPIWIEPTSLKKCHKILSCPPLHHNIFISPNLIELKQMASIVDTTINFEFELEHVDKLLNQVIHLSKKVTKVIPSKLMVTMGKYGTLMFDGSSNNDEFSSKNLPRYYSASKELSDVVNSSGAGDCGAAGFISGLLRGLTEAECITLAHLASFSSLQSKYPVPAHQFLSRNLKTVEPSKGIILNF